MNYVPKPIDTKMVELSPELLALTEVLAENAHDQWAQRRMEEGWRYGESRNDGQKTSPCLIPYQDLPDSEKAYDRETAMETIKVLVKLGYGIEKKTGERNENREK